MPDKSFLEEYPLLRKLKINIPETLDRIASPAIRMYCKTCQSEQTHNMYNNYWDDAGFANAPSKGRIVSVKYICASCKKSTFTFYIKISDDLQSIHKIGQDPAWEIKLDKELEKSLHGHASIYKKGLVCESQGYGIAAFAYYRRIVEEIIDELLASIADLIDGEEKEKYLKVLEETKKTRVAQEKIDLVKDLLPSILRPGGHNPLGVLHSALSEGLHSESDDECLEIAHSIREILVFLINQIIKSKETAKSFTDSMRKILNKKSGTNNS